LVVWALDWLNISSFISKDEALIKFTPNSECSSSYDEGFIRHIIIGTTNSKHDPASRFPSLAHPQQSNAAHIMTIETNTAEEILEALEATSESSESSESPGSAIPDPSYLGEWHRYVHYPVMLNSELARIV
jgi:hypothetical protein